ncbi:ABC transporter substrate-binding protein [Pseudoalteromonas sp. SSM20]|uniref:ABC transporter substrate-binding protein n=1 Tax=Pseudoalteromonas sp. SSM20 TaxID=3139394 RepID=UPI003BA8CB79
MGMSAAFSGPSAQLGVQLEQGARVFFDEVNASGGVNGRLIELLSRDDQYEPHLTVINTRYFINTAKVDALFSYVGTPTSNAIQPIIDTHNIPYLTPFTGADLLRHKAHIFNLRASYNDEAKVQIDYLVKHMGFKKIAFLIQADEFGLSVQNGLEKAMQPYALKPVEIARFKRNTQDIEEALKRLKGSGAEAICLVGTYKPLAHFINLAARQNYNPQFTSVSFVSSEELFSRIKQPSRILVTEVMPTANGCSEEWCKRFLSLMEKAGVDKPSRVHLEGYANAYLFYNAAKGCNKLTNDCLLLGLNKAKEKLDKAKRNYVELSEKVKGNTVFLNHFTYSK